jgi:hypothetical protein
MPRVFNCAQQRDAHGNYPCACGAVKRAILEAHGEAGALGAFLEKNKTRGVHYALDCTAYRKRLFNTSGISLVSKWGAVHPYLPPHMKHLMLLSANAACGKVTGHFVALLVKLCIQLKIPGTPQAWP